MIGIQALGSYIPQQRINNKDKEEAFALAPNFLEKKLGVLKRAQRATNQSLSDLCLEAFISLQKKTNLNIDEIEVIIVVTQNPDQNIPHQSAIIHGDLGCKTSCACFDISLGCSGYVYALSVIHSFMQANKLKKGLLFTADPYSNIIDPEDKNTALLFGDAASVTLLSDTPVFNFNRFHFGTIGSEHKELMLKEDKLFMNGRSIFNFAAQYVPKDVTSLLSEHKLNLEDVDSFLFHQGSKYIVDTIIKRLKLDPNKVPYDIYEYGNTVSSSIPILLEKTISSPNKTLLLSGFGVGLSWASTILTKEET